MRLSLSRCAPLLLLQPLPNGGHSERVLQTSSPETQRATTFATRAAISVTTLTSSALTVVLNRRPRQCLGQTLMCGVLREPIRFASSTISKRKRRTKPSSAHVSRAPSDKETKHQRRLLREAEVWPGSREKDCSIARGHGMEKYPEPAVTTSEKFNAQSSPTHGDDSDESLSCDEYLEKKCATNISTESAFESEDPLNLRLATLMQQPEKAFRVMAVTYSPKRELNFSITFEDIASGAALHCRLDEVQSVFMEWARQFRASWVVLFVPTLAATNAVLLENALVYRVGGRAPNEGMPASTSKQTEEPDYVLISYSKLCEVISKTKRDEDVRKDAITSMVLNASADVWRTFIHSTSACSPAAIMMAAFDFKPSGSHPQLNKRLLHAQLSTAATALRCPQEIEAFSCEGMGSVSGSKSNGWMRRRESWKLVFVSAPPASLSGSITATPPMQDLLTGEFVEPMMLGDRNVIYIVGSGTAAEAFARFPLLRKGKRRLSILLKDIENQLGINRPARLTLTITLIQALDTFSRYTWTGLMKEEDGTLLVPRPPHSFVRLDRRSVKRETLPKFLETALGHTCIHNSMDASNTGTSASGGAVGRHGAHGKCNRRLEEHMRLIFDNTTRLQQEMALRDKIRNCMCYFIDLKSANVTAARRMDNPFSARNGILEFSGQLWSSLNGSDADVPPVETLAAKTVPNSSTKVFVEPELCIPREISTCRASRPTPKSRRAALSSSLAPPTPTGIIVAWDVKRVLLFLRESDRLHRFLYNGGRIWCAQYAQYLLRGFNNDNLSTMERTLLQYHTTQEKLHPLEKLRIIFEKQLDIAVSTRQLISIVHRMDGLLASAEMEIRGLQLAPQQDITGVAQQLRASRDEMEKLVNRKIFEFTKDMDDEVRRRINFRSSQDISTIIYGGAMCRHLGARSSSMLSVSENAIVWALKTIDKFTRSIEMDTLIQCTAVVVVTCKLRSGSFIELFTMYCPSSELNEELKYNVAVDDVLPPTSEPDIITITQLKERITSYEPLRCLQFHRKNGRHGFDQRNLLILTNSTYDKTSALVDSGIIQTIAETVLGKDNEQGSLLERVCFCDLHRAFPPPPQGDDTFENDFIGLVDVAEHAGLSARGNWEALTRNFVQSSRYSTTIKALMMHCATLVGTARDPFRSSHPLPFVLMANCRLPRWDSSHGQEQASTRGLLWMVTPDRLHPLLYKSLRGKSASSGADAIERINALLSNEKQVDLSFFKALQQLRFIEKQMQLFEEGALFRAVLPECNGRVHGEFCHAVTATGRLSSQSPNLQNIPKEEDLRRLIVSRFGRTSGRMIEADYSQLEVVVLAALSRDTRMLQELSENVDFHCLRVSLMTKEPYEDVVRKVRKLKDPRYIQLRQQAKTFSFQRQYGAGISTIATTTGLTEGEVERLIGAEEQHYKELSGYYRLVTDCVEAGADRLLKLRSLDMAASSPEMRRMILMTEPMHYFVVQTGSKFDFTKDKKSVPRLKNYPVQGLAGEIVQIMCGKIIRRFFDKHNYNERAFLVNTVHDCVWIDAHASVAEEVMRDVSFLMSSTSEVINSLWPDVRLDVPFKAEIHIGPSLGELSK
uniref:Mitochondrial DNA polymerase I protein C n=1 Tax=Trypanosoma vivax (strain Y486) TaxID=1055687 RepID=G0TYL8_TRYVY|nr:mitochondrial DNA polymerase I protein C, fragment [Trypanosoma vivax Y486]